MKRLFMFLSVVTSAFLFTSTLSAQQETVRTIIDRGKIIFLAKTRDNPPYLFYRSGRWQGLEMEFVTGLSSLLNVPWEIKIMGDDNEILQALEDSEGDVLISGQKINIFNADTLYYSEPYMKNECYILAERLRFLRMNNDGQLMPFLEKKGTYSEVLVGVGSLTHASLFLNTNGYNSIEYNSYEKKIEDLMRGFLTVCIVDSREYDNYFAKNPEKLLYYRAFPLDNISEYIGLAVYWKDYEFMEIINAVILDSRNNSQENFSITQK